jgi:molecular chaperone HtpG
LLSQIKAHAFPGLDGVNFKVSSATLGHTLSRDDVLRDQAFVRVLGAVGQLAEDDLMDALERALDTEATRMGEALAAGQSAPSSDSIVELLNLVVARRERFEPGRIRLPLIRPWRASPAIRASDLQPVASVLIARVNNAFARSIEIDQPVLYAPRGVVECLGELLPGVRLRWLHEGFVKRTRVEPDGADQLALLLELAKCLQAAGVSVEGVELARFDGRRAGGFALAIPGTTAIAEHSDVRSWALCIDPDDTLFLDVEHDVTLVALQKARGGNGRRVAGLLARLLLLEHAGAPSPRASDGLLGYLITEDG